MPAPSCIRRSCGRGSGACGAAVPRGTAARARCPGGRGGSLEKRSDGLGIKSTGNGKPVRTRVKRKRNARVGLRIKRAK